MHAPKIPKPSSTTFDAPIPQTANLQALHLQKREKARSLGNFSPVMRNSFGLASSRVLETKKAELAAQQQGKGTENVKAQSQPTDALSGGGQSLSPALMAKYEGLLGGKVSLGGVRVHQGTGVDAALAESGLQGLTDGKNVAVSSRADRGTLEHELGHVAQQQQSGFNLNEGTRGGYELDADRIAERLVSGRTVEGLDGGGKETSSPLQEKKGGGIQAKCQKCDEEDKKLMGKSDETAETQVAHQKGRSQKIGTLLSKTRSMFTQGSRYRRELMHGLGTSLAEAMGECFGKRWLAILSNIALVSTFCVGDGLISRTCIPALGLLGQELLDYVLCVRSEMKKSTVTLSSEQFSILSTHLNDVESLLSQIDEIIAELES